VLDREGDHRLPEHRTREQADARHRRDVIRSIQEQQAAESGPRDTSLSWTVRMLVLPYFLIVAAAAGWFFVVVEAAEGYQQVLRRIYPGSWIGVEASHSTNTVLVGVLLVAVLTGLLLLRRSLGRRWVRGSRGPGILRLGSFVLSAAIVVVLVLAPGLLFGAGVIVESMSSEAQPLTSPTGPIFVTAVAAMWWSIGASRRSVRRAARRRVDS
jgi:hypothetical protein